MPVPYGFGVGDFVALGTLAWNVYKSCKAAPGSFENISIEVLSLHAALKEAEETLFVSPLTEKRADRLKVIKDGCEKVLTDLQSLVQKYETLGTQSKRTWDRIRWGNEDIAEIRARLTSNITILTSFISTSQVRVEIKLDKFIEEFHKGRMETSIVSLQTVDSLSAGEKVVWRTIRKELEEIGISVAAFEANRDFIFAWFVHAVEAGAFEEQNAHNVDDESNTSDGQEQKSDEEYRSSYNERHIADADPKVPESISKDRPLVRSSSAQSAQDPERRIPKRSPEGSNQTLASTKLTQKFQMPRLLRLAAFVTQPRRLLMGAIEMGAGFQALKLLKDGASFHLLDRETLSRALWRATCQSGSSYSRPLVAELISRGGNVNYISRNPGERSPLWNSVANGALDTVRLLVENGADINYTGSNRTWVGEALDFAPRASLKQDISILKFLISSGLNVNISYAAHVPPSNSITTGFSLLHEAASLGEVSAVETLLENGATIDLSCPNYGTALMLAILQRHEDAARLLLEKGADPRFEAPTITIYYQDRPGDHDWYWYGCPIEAAIIGGEVSLVRLLLDRGIVPDDRTLRLAKDVAHGKQGGNSLSHEDAKIIEILTDAVERGQKDFNSRISPPEFTIK